MACDLFIRISPYALNVSTPYQSIVQQGAEEEKIQIWAKEEKHHNIRGINENFDATESERKIATKTIITANSNSHWNH